MVTLTHMPPSLCTGQLPPCLLFPRAEMAVLPLLLIALTFYAGLSLNLGSLQWSSAYKWAGACACKWAGRWAEPTVPTQQQLPQPGG